MSDKPISVGDLVMVVLTAKCGHGCGIGGIHRVVGLEGIWDSVCGECDKPLGSYTFAMCDNGKGYGLYRLKRLDPDALKDDVPTKEELHA